MTVAYALQDVGPLPGTASTDNCYTDVMLDPDVCYPALVAKDPRFDGLFFVGVSTTSIYCRSVCPGRKPRASSCSYYPSAAAAEAAGFRPCLRCRPELAPSGPIRGEASAIATGIITRIQEGYLNDGRSVSDLAGQFDLSERQLRRLVKRETGVTPAALAQTARLLLAKQLLSETDLSVTRVAFDSGFASLRRFNELFASEYRVSPREFRRHKTVSEKGAELVLRLAYRPPLEWRRLTGFLAARAIPGVEHVREDIYERTVSFGESYGWLRIEFDQERPEIRVRVASTLSPHLQLILSRVRQLLDLNARPDLINDLFSTEPHLRRAARAVPGLRVPGAFDGFELAWRAILGQQVTVAGATTLAGRFAARFGTPVETLSGDLRVLTPSSATIARSNAKEIASIGLPLARAGTILAVARMHHEHPSLLTAGAAPEVARRHLAGLPGVGPWTIEYILMRALHFPDAFPTTDLGLRKSAAHLGIPDLGRVAERWRPWRAYAAMHLWTMDH